MFFKIAIKGFTSFCTIANTTGYYFCNCASEYRLWLNLQNRKTWILNIYSNYPSVVAIDHNINSLAKSAQNAVF